MTAAIEILNPRHTLITLRENIKGSLRSLYTAEEFGERMREMAFCIIEDMAGADISLRAGAPDFRKYVREPIHRIAPDEFEKCRQVRCFLFAEILTFACVEGYKERLHASG